MSDDLAATEITVTYPGGKHTFSKVGPDAWTLDLEVPPEARTDRPPSITGYDNGNVLRVVSSFLQGTS